MSKKLHKVLILTVVLIVVVLALASCKSDDKKEEKAKTPINIQLSWVHEAEYACIYIADQEGYYADEGLAAQIKPGGFGDAGYVDSVEQVTSGAADFGMASAEQIFSARVAGKPIVAIGNYFQTTPRIFMSLADKAITRPSDFVGKRVAVRNDSSVVYYAMLKVANVNPADITEVTDPALFSLDALINSEVDVLPGFITSEPIQLEQRGVKINSVLASDYGIEDFPNVYITTQDMIDKKPDEVTGFLRATLKGCQYALDNPDKVAASVLKFDPKLDANFVTLSWARNVPLVSLAGHNVGDFDLTLWQAYYQILLDQGVLTQPLDINTTYTRAFLDKIYPK